MKKLSIFMVAFILTVSTAMSAPFSFGDEDEGSYRDRGGDNADGAGEAVDEEAGNEAEEEEESRGEAAGERENRVVTKDTSWFDYRNPQEEYTLYNEADLMGLASLVNETQTDRWKPTRVESFEGVTFRLANDIELTQPWTPIGSDSAIAFAGVFDGDGHTISNVEIEGSSANTGFFGYLTGEVKNLTVKGTVSSQDSNCGAIAGQLTESGKVTDCVSEAEVSGRDKTGGIVGYNNGGSVSGCINKGPVSGTIKAGGVVGENWGGTITECGNEGSVESSSRGVATFGTGGVAGRSVAGSAYISDCYNRGEITSSTEATGGVVGYCNASDSTVKSSYNTGTITVENKRGSEKLSESAAGGVVGTVGTDGVVISDCYSSGSIKGADIAGGVIGVYIASNSDDTDSISTYINNCYCLSSSAENAVGDNNGSGGDNIRRSAESVSAGTLSGMSATLGMSFMRDHSGLYGNSGYPVLRWQEQVSDEERTYIEGLSREIQVSLNRHMAAVLEENSESGRTIIYFFNPESAMESAFEGYDSRGGISLPLKGEE
ncbi:MAG TPA: hypothetical protein IAC50_02160 [Candidatus Copromorpha excrementigallinarum]|uniref:GLUG domain-containing protein n=1 Tax=Candidatus Allocopromorpha excrementigallinarum TaxID=2840742 RepID=A0A9D1HZ55_9FIRM|nr:hypothetical protein [Candidatus Copromorpha excrementigallinarum]